MIKQFSIVATAALLTSAYGTEFTLEEGKFEQKVSFHGLAKPQTSVEISIAPKVWGDFFVEKVLAHGSKVKKGEKLVWIDTEKCDAYIAEQEKERALDAIKLESAQKELAELKVNTARSMARAKTNYDRAVADYAYYTEVTLPATIKSTKLNGEIATWSLANAEEELRQLLKMYAEDGLTEETEEIIVQRSKNSVKYSRHKNEKAQELMKRELAVTIPREQMDKKRAHEKALLDWEFYQRTLPVTLKKKEIAVAKLVMAEAKKAKKFAEAKADRKAMEMVAPASGYVYYGEFDVASWKRDIANKYLVKGMKLPAKKVFMTIIPENAKLELSATVNANVASKLKVDLEGLSQVNSSPWTRFPSKVTAISSMPNVQSTWSVDLSTEVPKGVNLYAGESVHLDFVTYKKDKALSIPSAAVTEKSDGTFTVDLKMADGEVHATSVKLGQSSGGNVEVLSGLSAGQVIQYGDE